MTTLSAGRRTPRRVSRRAKVGRLALLGAVAGIGSALGAAAGEGAGYASGATLAQTASPLVIPYAGTGGFSKTETINRDFLVNGEEEVVDKRTVTLGVSQTENLRGRQEITVTWSGAHPTGGIISDQNSIDAQQEEYPFVLLECRGTDSTTVPAAERLSPETCWTQTWSERYQDTFQTDYPPYRLDQFATAAGREQVVGAPSTLPASCKYLPAPTQHWVPFIAADGTVYYEGPAGCAGQPPESQNVSGSSDFPSNETFGVTALDGRGSADFDLWTTAENASLGCSQTVACSLVAVPIMGISCAGTPAAGAENLATCEEKGAFAPGQLVSTPQNQDDLTVSGSLWWSPSNWRNRISVPLTFAVPASACSVIGAKNSVLIYGSELLIQATGQWAPHFCLSSKLFTFVHVQTGEPEARNLLATGGIDAAFTSYAQPGGYGKPVVSAPIAVTGFSISYIIDGANGQPYTHLRLTPLLLAKLLTESYPAELPVQEEDPALAHNPLNITDDPEFQQLNPGITHGVGASEAASELMTLSSDSDVIEALTTYINDNPQARAWLNGKPDPWGMVVNPAYRDIKLPVNEWPLLSTFEPTKWYQQDENDCLFHDPVPYLPLVAAPQATLEEISESMQFDIANSTVVCQQINGESANEKLVALGPQTIGYRFLIGITPLADNYRYQLRAAALQTSGGNFVTPTASALRTAAALLAPDESSGTWLLPYGKFTSSKAAAGAYPGTMVVYAAVPTTGLPAQSAEDYAALLRYAAGSGQDPGLAVGQLPPGYLPMTKADGLGALANYTLRAAADVEAQNGKVPPLIAPPPTKGHNPPPTTTTTPSSTTSTTPSSPTTTTAPATTPTTTTTPSTPTTTPTRGSGHSHPGSGPTSGGTPSGGGQGVLVSFGRAIGVDLGNGMMLVAVALGLALACVAGILGALMLIRRKAFR
jgi:hypothetical protein